MALRNAFENVSTEATLAELRDMVARRATADGGANLISGNRLRYRREFNDPALSEFNVVAGPGMTVTSGTGVMTIAAGTTPNSTTTVTTKQTFAVPFKASFGFKISQKIANTEFYCELVAVNDDGTLDETCVAAWKIAHADSSNTSQAKVETRNGGSTRSTSGLINLNSNLSDNVFEIVIESDEVQFHNRLVDNGTSRAGSQTRNSVAPDPNRQYALRYRVATGATAPTSSTTLTAAFVTAIDYTEIQTEITGGPGHGMSGQAIPILITGGTAGIGNNSIQASSSVGGTSVAKVNSAATTNATLVKSAAGRLYGYQLANTSASWRYVKFYNMNAAPAVGTSVPLYTVPIAPGQTSDLTQTVPITHGSGISYAITANPADNDTTAIGAGDVVGYITFA